MVTHVTPASHEPSYGRRMAVITTLATLVLALSMGVAGGFLAWITYGVTIGTLIGSSFHQLATRRARRKLVSPWTAAPSIDVNAYLWRGGIVGAAVGVALGIADIWLA